jgi:hypothetical protein
MLFGQLVTGLGDALLGRFVREAEGGRMRLTTIALCMATAASSCLAAPSFSDTLVLDALWIGNSFTAKYVLPNSLRTMFRGAPGRTYISLRNTERIEWGQNLSYHYNSTDALDTLLHGNFDYVMLQDFPGDNSAASQQNLQQYGTLFVNAALSVGTVPVIFWTWPPYDRTQLDAFIQMYDTFCAGKNVVKAPVNVAWRRVFQQRPDYPLYNDDGLHQSQYGHYLNLCVFYSVFEKISPVGNTYRVWGEYPAAPLTLMAADTAAYLQAQAWAVVDSVLGPFASGVARPAVLPARAPVHSSRAYTVVQSAESWRLQARPAELLLLNGALVAQRGGGLGAAACHLVRR